MVFSSSTTAGTCAGYTWRIWVNDSAVVNAGTCEVWPTWVNNSDTNTSITSGTTAHAWTVWNQGYKLTVSRADLNAVTVNLQPAWGVWNETYEQKAERLRNEAALRTRWQAEQAERERKAKKAQRLARKVLCENLTRRQRQTLERLGYFDIEVKGRRFRIHANRYQHNVRELDAEGREMREYCAHTSHACPVDDHLLAQKLMLETEPDEFARIANVWDLRSGRRLVSSSGQPLGVELPS